MSLVRSLAVFSVLSIACAINMGASAQTRVNNSGTGGVNIIKGQIFVPGSKRADGQVTVRLQSITYGELTLLTDQSGGFEFRSLSPGTYAIVVDAGEAFETARESITIDPQVRGGRFPGSIPLPSNPKVYNVPVYLQLKHNPSEKTGVVNAKLAAVPKEALRHYQKGLDLVQTGKADEAVAEFKLAVGIYPALPPAYVELGKIYLRTGRMDDAADALALAIRYDPNDFEANLNHGIALYGKRDFAAAEAEFIKAAQLSGTAVTPHYYLGMLFIQTQKLEKAQQELETAKQLKGDKNFPTLHRHLGDVYLARNLDKLAVAEFETYLLLAPNAQDAARVRQRLTDLKSRLN